MVFLIVSISIYKKGNQPCTGCHNHAARRRDRGYQRASVFRFREALFFGSTSGFQLVAHIKVGPLAVILIHLRGPGSVREARPIFLGEMSGAGGVLLL